MQLQAFILFWTIPLSINLKPPPSALLTNISFKHENPLIHCKPNPPFLAQS